MSIDLRDWIDYDELDLNISSENSNEIELLFINSINISKNPNAIKIFEENPDKIDWFDIPFNPTYDYQKIKKDFEELGEEIIAKALHPKRIFRLIAEYGEDEVYDNYFE